MAEPVSLGRSLLAADDVRGAVLQEVHSAALCPLKAASAAWCAHARRELCARLCTFSGGVVTELDVECLNEAGRPWEVVVAARQLPHLAKLRGFGFAVELQAVRAVYEADRGQCPLQEDEYDEVDRVTPTPNPYSKTNPNPNRNPNPNPISVTGRRC